jgi:hypothetical protein
MQQAIEAVSIRGRHGADGIEGRKDEPLFVLGQINVRDGDRVLAVSDGEVVAQMAIHDVARALIDEDSLHPTHVGECPV